ncbi:sensor histidine kinase [Pseudonocardia nigra]|uniref:sensor histidine kinase n=1 Tax=Pseudonocardia nigra TaxID=1921578 RepID=UPI001C5CE854|nr:sensor histidine kinase [Pseudonocardia nigra]
MTDAAAVPAGAGARGIWLWDVLYAIAAAATSVLVVLDNGGAPAAAGAVALVAVGAVGWFAVGRRMALAEPARPEAARLTYCGLITVALAAAVALAPEANWALFVVLPQLFWLLPLRWGITAAVVLTPGLPALGAVVHGGGAREVLADLAPQILFMSAFGVLVGVYIHRVTEESDERGRLITALEASRAREAELSHRAGAAAERERLAGEIHDTLAQGFTSIVTLLQAAQAEFDADPGAARRHVDLAVRAAKENLQEARHLVAAGAPTDVVPHPLADAVGRQAERFAEETGVDTGHGVSGEPRRLPAEQEIVLLRAAQELLTNVARHAGAGTVTVRLDFRDPHAVALTVADDGAGFAPDAVPGGHFGLAMMRSRLERLGGSLELDTAPGAGTTAVVTLPSEGAE